MNWLIVPLILLLAGLGYSQILIRSMPNYGKVCAFLVSPLLGSAILIIEGGLLAIKVIDLYEIKLLVVTTIFLSVLLSIRSIPRYEDFISLVRKISFLSWVKWMFFVFTILVISLRLNPFHDNFLYLRLSVDLAGYASATSEILNIPTNDVFASGILDVTHRWGLPAISALIYSLIPWHINVYEVLFGVVFTMFVSGALSIGFIFSQVLSNSSIERFDKESIRDNVAFVIALLIVANSTQINFINDGFYPQIMSAAMLGVVLAFFMLLRNLQALESTRLKCSSLGREKIKIILIFALFFGAIAITISEVLMLGITFLAGILLLDLFIFDRPRVNSDFLVGAGVLIGLLLAFPITKELVSFINNDANSLGKIGYPQPNWMFPSELVGIGSIYADVEKYLDVNLDVHTVSRSNIGLILGCCASLAVIFFASKAAFLVRDIKFILTVIFGISGFFITNYFLSHSSNMPVNYAYNKLSSIFSGVLISFVVIGVWVSRKNSKLEGSLYHQLFLLLIIGIALTSAVLTLKDLRRYSTSIDVQSMAELSQQLKGCNCALLSTERGLRGNEMIGKLRYVDRTADLLMNSMTSIPILDQWDKLLWSLLTTDNAKVYLIIRKDFILPKVIKLSRVLAQSRTYLVINTTVSVEELKKKSGIELAKWINDELAKD